MVAEVIEGEVQQLLGGKSLARHNDAFLERHGTESLLHRAAAAEMMALLEPQSKPKAVQVILKRGGLVGAASQFSCPRPQRFHSIFVGGQALTLFTLQFLSLCPVAAFNCLHLGHACAEYRQCSSCLSVAHIREHR